MINKAKGLDNILKDNVQEALKKRVFGGKNQLIKTIVDSLTKAKAERALRSKLKQQIEEEENKIKEEEERLKQQGFKGLREARLSKEQDLDDFFAGLMANLADRPKDNNKS
ncbi:unnamed protein product [Dimorphilus gyrociliatus]|uniref:Uncharacterized protein n=1 Tax=Dimorphilus gyrociliatus TaxID=2664684 RepID=A0A7I8VAF0_9ANNE|nr:unnamed protein product [Dimorphilus gyrociliatus]